MHQTFKSGDAIGHDIQGMYDAIASRNMKVSVFCEHSFVDAGYSQLSLTELKRKIKNKGNVIIYHHSVLWLGGEEILKEATANVVIKYHNITPESFFEPYSDAYFKLTSGGREQTQRFVKNNNFFWLCDSEYNRAEIVQMGYPVEKTGVVAPFHKVNEFEKIVSDYKFEKYLKDQSVINVIFIGRVVPNKGLKRICQTSKSYQELYNHPIKFWIIGGFDQGLHKYNDELMNYIQMWGLKDTVSFTDKVSPSQLKSFIVNSDIFLCLSEHEGFCVPLIESQYYELPIIAVKSSAIAETLGPEQLVFDTFNEDRIAAAIHEVSLNKEYSDYLSKAGKENFKKRFTQSIIEQVFIQHIDRILKR